MLGIYFFIFAICKPLDIVVLLWQVTGIRNKNVIIV